MTKSFMPERFRILSGSTLKLIAAVTMLIDHTAYLLEKELPLLTIELFSLGDISISLYYIMRKIGRLSFPIFCFLIAQGFIHTRNRKRYGLNLLIFALISEIPFNLMLSGSVFYIKEQNVIFTLLFGFLLLYILENTKEELVKVLLMLCIGVLCIIVKADYGLAGSLLILLIYVLKEKPAAQMVISYPLLSGGSIALCSFIPINMYNGKRGFINSGIMKYGFYLFYPLHIVILVAIKLILK